MSYDEPIIHDEQRLSLYPIKDQKIWEYYNNHKSVFWTAEEIDLTLDKDHWKNLTKDEQYYIEMVLGFFAGSDLIVNQHIEHDFLEKITLLELQIYYRFQAMMEDIHSKTYADLINTLVTDYKRRDELFNAVVTVPIIKKKADWAKHHIYKAYNNDVESFVRRLVVFACVEGIFFSGSFCSIFWLKKRGIMPGLTKSNEFISRDEGIHRDTACYVYRHLIKNKLPETDVIQIVKDAVSLEQEFVSESLPVALIGMNAELMCQYIEYVADHLLMALLGKRYFNTENPFDWMTLLSIENKANFFETRVASYVKGTVENINFEEDF